jgi:Zn-dependent protease
VTALNLFPLSQLDGGHILYALMGPQQRWIGTAFLIVLLGSASGGGGGGCGRC